MPRPSKLTKETQVRLEGMLSRGVYMSHAAGAIGVDRRTIAIWLKRGQEDREAGHATKYASLLDAVEVARARGAAAMTEVITRAAGRDWKAAAWFLERVHPEEFGPVKDFTVRHSGHVTHLSKEDLEDLADLTDAELDQIEAGLSKVAAVVHRAEARSRE